MKRDKNTPALKLNAYYLIVLVGILALATMVVIDTLQTRNTQNESNQRIELTDQSNKVDNDTIHQTIGDAVQPTTEEAVKDEVETAAAALPANKAPAAEPTVSYDGKTKLEWPLIGNVVLPYSMDTTIYFQTLDQYKCNPGMLIQAAEKAEVSNISQGKVLAVKKDAKLGNMVTVDIGNGYQIEYGQLDKVNLKKGDMIDAGMVIGQVAEPTQFFSLEGTHLYLAITKDKEPVNPMEYLK